jgi:hypothetical protein
MDHAVLPPFNAPAESAAFPLRKRLNLFVENQIFRSQVRCAGLHNPNPLLFLSRSKSPSVSRREVDVDSMRLSETTDTSRISGARDPASSSIPKPQPQPRESIPPSRQISPAFSSTRPGSRTSFHDRPPFSQESSLLRPLSPFPTKDQPGGHGESHPRPDSRASLRHRPPLSQQTSLVPSPPLL